MIENVNAIINNFNPDKIVYVKSTGKALVISLKGFSTKALPTPEFDSRLKLVNHTIFTKVNTGDAFESRELENFLRDKNAKEIVLTGLLAENCISATALGGKKRGYEIILVPEAIAGKSNSSKEKALEKLKKEGLKSLPLNELIIKP